jgi:tetratricopeptide (TPR) repeat protein
MSRSSISARLLRTSLVLIAALAAGAAARAQIPGSGGGRFVDLVEVEDHDDQADIVVRFNCSLRYITHVPAAEGRELRVQLLPQGDCGLTPGAQILGELPPLSGGGRMFDAVRVDADVPGQLTLAFSFHKSEHYVIAQGADLRGLRLRLIDRARGRGKIMLNEPSGPVSSYAVNLESQPKDFTPEALQAARDRLKVAVFVSQAVVDEETWYRLRAGPFDKRTDAEQLLLRALADYPRAWLAIGDDAATQQGSGETLPAVERIGADPPIEPAALAKLIAGARVAMGARDYPKAIGLLTKLQRQPEFAQRAAMQELLGLARERSGQLAHAKAEYEEYLRRYPAGEAAERITRRLQVLRAASTQARTGTGGGAQAARGWTVNGGFGQTYRYDGTSVTNSASPTVPVGSQTQSSNGLYNDVDLLARDRGARFDLLARASVGYAKNFGGSSATSASSSNKRISVASFEIADPVTRLFARIGRQSQNLDGALGTFDGLFATWQMIPTLGLAVTTGFPVEQTSVGVRTDRRFWALALPYTPVGRHWDTTVFFTQQQYDGFTDRRAVGLQARLLLPKSSVTALLDYDVFYKSLNTAALLGTMQLPDRWNLSFDAERRNAPVLTTRNALIGEPFTSLTQLLLFDEQIVGLTRAQADQQIYGNARASTPISENFSLTATRPLGLRFQFAATVSAQKLGATAGVTPQPGTKLDLSYQAQVYGSNLWREGDFNVLSASYFNTETAKTAALGLTTRWPVASAWRLGPRLTIQRLQIISDGSHELDFVPSALLDYSRGQRLLQFEAGGQLGKRDSRLQTQNTKRYYVSLSYRIGF